DRDKFEAAHLGDERGEAGRPATSLTPENRLQRRALLLVGPLIDEKAHSGLGLARPEIAFELAQSHQTESIKPNIAVMTFPDMPDKHARAGIVGRRLGKFAGAWNVAAADVEPIADKTPFRDRAHGRASLRQE